MPRPTPEAQQLARQEIAARAARLIAEDGLDYASAKRKAVREVLGSSKVQGDLMPDNEEIAEEVRIYQQLFQADTQPARLAELRRTALALMRLLKPFQPYLTGAVLNGTAGTHSDIHLQLFTDSAKDVEIFLLNQGIDFDAQEAAAERGRVEVLSFMWPTDRRGRIQPEGAHLNIHTHESARAGAAERADVAALERLIDESEQPS
jgi:hypothetical protein